MKINSFSPKGLTLFVAFITVLSVSLSGQSKNAPADAVTLAYNIPAGEKLVYRVSTDVAQLIEVEGQTVNVMVNNKLVFQTKLLEKKKDNMVLEVTVDSLSTNVNAMGSVTQANIGDVSGKSFKMVLAPDGKVIDASEAAKIEYFVEGQGSGNLGQTFLNVFPKMSAKPVKPGDRWTSSDSVQTVSAGTKVLQSFEYSNTYEGNEVINGKDCAKIVSDFKGTMETSTQNMGMDILVHGPISGQSVVYFAIKEGYVVSQEETSKLNGTVEVTGQNMTFPVVMNTTVKLQLK
ncbi:MAG TPA: hypothetical protein PK910_04930 [Bacteroidales bacterium]|nr:hypothetical protein [Bacteroidales bacterium]HRC89346.1 hypothetical protein [Bacteroidales bacterium]